jgi:hypothetical protein
MIDRADLCCCMQCIVQHSCPVRNGTDAGCKCDLVTYELIGTADRIDVIG